MEREIRVYDPKGDFTIKVPEDAKVTFGYFNPTRSEGGAFNQQQRGYGNPGDNVARQTALRIYSGKTEKSNQLACFIGVTGFRDLSIDLVKLQESVTIIRQVQDDPENGRFTDNFERSVEMKAIPERGTYS